MNKKRAKLNLQDDQWNSINTTIHYFILKANHKAAAYSFSVWTDVAGFVRLTNYPQMKVYIGQHIETVAADHKEYEHHIIK